LARCCVWARLDCGSGTNLDLVAIAAVLLTSLVEAVFLGAVLHRMRDRIDADDAALSLQGKRIEAMRAELLRR
jgi:hypothetical protein